MAVFKNFNDDELIISCRCGCDEGIHFNIANFDDDDYVFVTYTSGDFYVQQAPFVEKLQKIWAIIRNKDFYYSEITMSKSDFKEFVKWVNKKANKPDE